MSVRKSPSRAGASSQAKVGSNYANSFHIDSQPQLDAINIKPTAKQVRQQTILSKQEEHAGWLENVRSEKRSIIMSLQNTLKRDSLKNKDRVQRLLDLEVESVASKEYDPFNITLRGGNSNRFRSSYQVAQKTQQAGPIVSKNNLSNSVVIRESRHNATAVTAPPKEGNFLSKMIAGRNQLYLEPFDVFDPHHPLRGKKRFQSNFRPIRSKINIKIEADEVVKKKRDNKVTVDQKVIDDFEKAYAENCDQKLTRIKNRNVSYESPFDPKNKPPDQYLRPEVILDKPGKIDLNKIDVKKIPLAGKLGTLGQKILSDFKNARQLTDYDWDIDCLMTEQIPRAVMGRKPPQPITEKLNQLNLTASNFKDSNFNVLHMRAQYPPQTSHSKHLNSTLQDDRDFRKMTVAAFRTSQGSRIDKTNLTIDQQSIRDDMSQSPKSIRATDRRVEFLVRAKQARNEKKMSIQGQTKRSTDRGDLQAWAADSSLNFKSPRKGDDVSDYTMASGQSRNSRLLHSQTINRRSPSPSGGGIQEPLDMAPLKNIVKSKNDSGFTTQLVNGERLGYSVGHGIQNSIKKPSFARNTGRNNFTTN